MAVFECELAKGMSVATSDMDPDPDSVGSASFCPPGSGSG